MWFRWDHLFRNKKPLQKCKGFFVFWLLEKSLKFHCLLKNEVNLYCKDKFNQDKTMDNLTPEQRRKNMQAIKSTATKEEVRIAKALWRLGYRYRKNNKKVFGKPDLTFAKYKIAIFIDSEFFHGKDWDLNQERIK